ncbi:hypothetical protein NIES37_72500 (plasmid) [Tolypothrix tenuis PCC 7101]|uniref:Uncharacterized protein n=1 Tax=Tolypothrix tenuis PCC 7101 TaxID=231146 RepID=A0A1Z4NBY9_9CYAN|nr:MULTISPECIES: hypothetical protein [Nostocaceae]MBD2236198.1 hypothetical protein [Aulosira sp. FACHB-113]BAZ03237.1 hypothetical protein NIES37_72500 [Tolypothrix tenuis PCC 7101]BAZ78490.1 hypothetical protein NIES50_71230 [Aulosira laxa NIES-50]MBD2458917.1 hypothetical protein [Nostoc sp. FACHB-87]MBD2479908.1 hypothetical protein [Anabaena sp. FACHB-83]
MKELIELPVEGLTPAMQACLLRELIAQLNIPDEKFEEYAKNPPTAEERQEAVLKLNSEINRISEIAQEEVKLSSTEIEPVNFVNPVSPESSLQPEASQYSETKIQPEVLKHLTNKNDDNNGNLVEECQHDKVQSFIANLQIQQFVIPVILDRLNIFGKPDKETESIIYKSEAYTASLKSEEDSQTLSLDRNSPDSEASQEALLASRNNSSENYSIIINNLTHNEFERFKALFDEQQARCEQNQQQFKNQDAVQETD